MLHYQTFRNKIRFVGIEWLVKEGTCIHKVEYYFSLLFLITDQLIHLNGSSLFNNVYLQMLMLMTHLKLLNGS